MQPDELRDVLRAGAERTEHEPGSERGVSPIRSPPVCRRRRRRRQTEATALGSLSSVLERAAETADDAAAQSADITPRAPRALR